MMFLHKFGLFYSWLVWAVTFFLPDIAVFMRCRGWLYARVMKKSGRNFQVSSGARLYSIKRLSVGDDVFIATNVVVNAGTDIILGSQVMLGIGAILVSGNHTLCNGSYRFGQMARSPIAVGFGSWIGANSTLVAGASIPPSTLIGANSVVTKPLQFSGTYCGAPAKLIKKNDVGTL